MLGSARLDGDPVNGRDTGTPARTRATEPAMPRLAVRLDARGLGVLALESIETGTRVLDLEGVLMHEPTRWSVQLTEALHVHPPDDPVVTADPDRWRWRFLNHGCDPNLVLRLGPGGPHFAACRLIAAFEELRFDYETTEARIAEPFTCGCEACDGRLVRGFAFLDHRERLRRADRLAPHLRSSSA